MQWWISPSGQIVSAPSSQQVSYESNGYKGPYQSQAEAEAALHSGSGSGSSDGKWYVVQVILGSGIHGASQLEVQQKPFSQDASEVAGPYATRAQAEKERAKKVKESQKFSLPSVTIPGLSGIERVGAVLEAFYKSVTDWHFWASLGWTLLGAVLLYLGIYLWVRSSNTYKAIESEITGAVGKV